MPFDVSQTFEIHGRMGQHDRPRGTAGLQPQMAKRGQVARRLVELTSQLPADRSQLLESLFRLLPFGSFATRSDKLVQHAGGPFQNQVHGTEHGSGLVVDTPDRALPKPHARKFGENTGLGVVIRYRDEQRLGHTCLVYVLAGKGFSVTSVSQYLDRDQEDVLPLIRRTLDSFQVAP